VRAAVGDHAPVVQRLLPEQQRTVFNLAHTI
jgi:hypothetical protein